MSTQETSATSPLKVFLGAMGVFVFFGFLALILSGYAGHESIEDRAYMGEFDAETIQQRWANLDEIESAQAELLDETKVAAAMVALTKDAPAASKSSVVVPGSPTFMKQMEAASAPADAEKPAADEEKPAPAEPEAKPAPEAAPKSEAKPKAEGKSKAEAKPKAESKPKAEAKPKEAGKAKGPAKKENGAEAPAAPNAEKAAE